MVPPCDQYWPDEVQGPVYYGQLIVNTISESVMSDYVNRVMEIKLVRSSLFCEKEFTSFSLAHLSRRLTINLSLSRRLCMGVL